MNLAVHEYVYSLDGGGCVCGECSYCILMLSFLLRIVYKQIHTKWKNETNVHLYVGTAAVAGVVMVMTNLCLCQIGSHHMCQPVR